MKITTKIGFSRCTINLNAEETAKYKAAPPRSYERHNIARGAWIREAFGSVENAVGAIKKFEGDLHKIENKLTNV